MKNSIPPNEIPTISHKDLKKLYDYAEKIINVGNRYGLPSIVSIYAQAYKQLKKG